MKSQLTLIGLDIEGDWNLPLLENAAAMFSAAFLSASGKPSAGNTLAVTAPLGIDELWDQFDHVVACESVAKSRSIYQWAAPRGRLAVLVGNERQGIPSPVLKRAEQVVSIPMSGRDLTSINVAAAAAVALYAIDRDFGRKPIRPSPLSQTNVDVLIHAPEDPSELGSFLRSAWAFGWRRLYLSDPGGVWFTKDRPTVLAGRAAARCEVNRIAVLPIEQLNLQDYDHVVVCDAGRHGTPLARFSPPRCDRMLLVYGDGEIPSIADAPAEHLMIDHAGSVEPRFRHAGSILLSVVSQSLRRGRRG